MERISLTNSVARHHPTSRPADTKPDNSEVIEATVVLKYAASDEDVQTRFRELAAASLRRRKYLHAADCSKLCSASSEHAHAVTAFARKHGLEVLEAAPDRN